MEFQHFLWTTCDLGSDYCKTNTTEGKTTYCKSIMQEENSNCKQFMTVTGSPILYTRYKRHKGIYYPSPKHHADIKAWIRRHQTHLCVVYSKMYGRETYGNIGIWPEDHFKELKSNTFHTISEQSDGNSDLQKKESEASVKQQVLRGTKDVSQTEKQNHHVTITVTDTSEQYNPFANQTLIHPHPDKISERDGTWPHKRPQRMDSRDNPFLPGGDLRKEADEILSKATIIRDMFILKELDENIDTTEHNSQGSQSDIKSESPANECMVQNDVAVLQCSTDQNVPPSMVQTPSPTNTRSKENGQLDNENSLAPGSVTLEITDDIKDCKKHNKCCTIM